MSPAWAHDDPLQIAPSLGTFDAGLRAVGYLAVAIFVGGLLFTTLLWPAGAEDRRTRRVLGVACLLGGISAVASIVVRGAYAVNGSLTGALRPDVISAALDTPLGRIFAAEAMLWLLAAIVLGAVLQRGAAATTSPGWRLAALAIGFSLIRTGAMTGHVEDGGWGSVIAIAHLTAIAAWLGGLTVLLAGLLPRRRADELAEVVPRFSRWALAAVVVIVGSGTVLAWRLLGSWQAFTETSYGYLLLAKIGLLALVLAAAHRSKNWVGTRLRLAVVLRGDASTVRPFVYSVAAETTLLLAVVTAASLLVTATPGR
ncbi:MAG TPA: copper resistance protein [Micromonosporaceae bacterium]|nr:copper resistance protein [Micromonosporaceae bacterium]